MSSRKAYRPESTILTLGADFYDAVEPADFPETTLRFANRRWAARIGLGGKEDAWWTRHFGRFAPLEGTIEANLALRYHGHQFRHYNPDIGDGRGFLYAQLRGPDGRLLDLGTKGSGQTPHSRQGDGRLTLKGGFREVLATEMLEALGVNTSKSFALVETGEQLHRGDEPSPTRSAVLTRLSHGHIRIGTFQRVAFRRDVEGIAKLVDYSLRHLYGVEPTGDDKADAQQLFDRVAGATARLAASYMAAGFVHGVLNSDNIAITGESFDYGPWRFTPYWDPDFVSAYFDHEGLYRFGRQPEAVHWDLAQLGGCLGLVAPHDGLNATLEGWPDRYNRALADALLWRLGVQSSDDDLPLAQAIIDALAQQDVKIDRFFFDWRGGIASDDPRYDTPHFRAVADLLDGRANEAARDHGYWRGEAPVSMHIEDLEARWSEVDRNDDWTAFNRKIDEIRRMGDAMRVGMESPQMGQGAA